MARSWAFLGLGCAVIGFWTRPAAASFINNGNGTATASVAVWCYPNRPPNPRNYFASFTGPAPSAFAAPGLAGCDPRTFISVAGVANQGFRWSGFAGSGDTVAYDGTDLLPFVTPTSSEVSVSGEISFTMLDTTHLAFHESLSESDAGAAERLEWFDENDPLQEVELGEMLIEGPFDGSIDDIIFAPHGVDELRFQFDAIAVSAVPEPSTLMLLGVGGLGLFGYTWRRRNGVASSARLSIGFAASCASGLARVR